MTLAPAFMVAHARKTTGSLFVLVFKTGKDLFVKVSSKLRTFNLNTTKLFSLKVQ